MLGRLPIRNPAIVNCPSHGIMFPFGMANGAVTIAELPGEKIEIVCDDLAGINNGRATES